MHGRLTITSEVIATIAQSSASWSMCGVCQMKYVALSRLQSMLCLVLLVTGSPFMGINETCSPASAIV